MEWSSGSVGSQHLGQPGFPGLFNTIIPFPDPWTEDWPEVDHSFRGSHKQPPDFREKPALPLLPPSHVPPPMSFPYPLQPSPPPLFPPLPQDTPFSKGQPFPPYEFKYSAVEDFSMPGCGPGMNFVPGPLPPSVSDSVSHGQHRGPVIHRGKPRCVLNNPYHVPRIRGPCRHRLRHSDRLIHTYKQDRRGHAHSGTWPG